MDVYTEFAAKASKYKNPVNDVGVTSLWGIDNIQDVLSNTEIKFIKEHSFTPSKLVDEMKPFDRVLFKMMSLQHMNCLVMKKLCAWMECIHHLRN